MISLCKSVLSFFILFYSYGSYAGGSLTLPGPKASLKESESVLLRKRRLASIQAMEEHNLRGHRLDEKQWIEWTRKHFSPSIRRLNLSGAMFDHRWLSLLPDYLIELDLNGVALKFKDLKRLSRLKQLRVLKANHSLIGDKGAVFIAKHYSELIVLSLNDSKIGDVGATFIATHLKHLSHLDLEENDIGDLGAARLARHLPGLVHLRLRLNPISFDGVLSVNYLFHLNGIYMGNAWFE